MIRKVEEEGIHTLVYSSLAFSKWVASNLGFLFSFRIAAKQFQFPLPMPILCKTHIELYTIKMRKCTKAVTKMWIQGEYKASENNSQKQAEDMHQSENCIRVFPISCFTGCTEGFFCLNPLIIFQFQITKHRQCIWTLVIHLQSLINL